MSPGVIDGVASGAALQAAAATSVITGVAVLRVGYSAVHSMPRIEWNMCYISIMKLSVTRNGQYDV